MIKVENIEVFNLEGAFRGLRNPRNSWGLSDSIWIIGEPCYMLGEKDLKLAQRMITAGTDESKFMRQIMVSMDITAPLFYWKEFDTYKVGTVANSCSTMHKLDTTPITRSCFSMDEELDNTVLFEEEMIPHTIGDIYENIIEECEGLRLKYLETKDKKYWRALVQILPESWNQKKTVTMNYQVCRAMYFARRNHKLTEWHDFCDILLTLPYGRELIAYDNKNLEDK